jgi:hypothetical protein
MLLSAANNRKRIVFRLREPAVVSWFGLTSPFLRPGTAHIDSSSGKPATPATKVRIASRILKNAAEGVTDADTLRFVAIEKGLCAAD